MLIELFQSGTIKFLVSRSRPYQQAPDAKKKHKTITASADDRNRDYER